MPPAGEHSPVSLVGLRQCVVARGHAVRLVRGHGAVREPRVEALVFTFGQLGTRHHRRCSRRGARGSGSSGGRHSSAAPGSRRAAR